MKKNEKKAILILVVVAVLIIGIIWLCIPKNNGETTNNGGQATAQKANGSSASASQGEYTKVESNGTIENTSETLKKERTESGFKLSNVTLKEEGGETKFGALVTNMTEEAQPSFYGKVELLDKAGNVIGEIPVMISETQKGEVIEIEATITESYANAYDYKLVK